MNSHTHHHHHHHHNTHSDYGRAFFVGITLNFFFIIAEIIYGITADSLALLADAGHNASDVLSLCIAWGAAKLARKAPSARFTYGLQSATIITALVNALLLLAAVGFIAWEAVQRFAQPEQPATGTVIAVALLGVAINGATAWLLHQGSQHDLNIRGAFLHMAADAAISLGVALAAAMIWLNGWLWLDPLTSLAIAAFIIGGSWRLFKEAMSLALHAVPQSIDATEVRNYLAALNGVKEVHDLHIWAMSTSGAALSAHLMMPGGHPGDAFIRETAHQLDHRFHIHHTTLQIEIGDDGANCEISCGTHS